MKKFLLLSMTVAALVSCSKDKDPVIIVPPSNGSTMELNGTTTNAGANAENSVFVDFSADKQTSVLRNSWDLGFYCGDNFKIVLNSTKAVTATVVNKTDLNAVTEADVDLNVLKIGLGAGSFTIIDDPREANILTKTVIAEVSATDANNKVYIINAKGLTNYVPVPVDSVFKIRVLRKGAGYSLQYAKLKESTFKSLDISKNSDYNFQFVSLFTGALVNVEPQKETWDITWSWNVYQTFSTETGYIPYGFSDIVLTNNLGGTTAFERVYASAEVAADAYTKFNKDSVAKYSFSNDRMAIGSNWRLTVASGGEPAGIRKSRFYVVKDAGGNLYKLKFISFIAADGGTRGRPQIQYELIK